MNRQIEQALLSMMPTHGSDLPPSLVELASSLLAQSRHRASTLKADEEIARHYACANIACERLKTSLDLPPIVPRPPIPPRIYTRLYTHLDNILPNPASTPRTSRTRTPSSKVRYERFSPTGPQIRSLASRSSPTKEATLAKFRTPTRTAGAFTFTFTTRRNESQGTRGGLHPWVQPVIRHMCAKSGHERLAPTVLAGVEHTVLPNGRPAEGEGGRWVLQHVTDLVAALYFFVIMRVRAITSGADMDREGYVPLRTEILALLAHAGREVAVPEHEHRDSFWEGWRDVKSRDFDTAVAKVNENSWLTGDWYGGITDVLDATAKFDAELSDDGQENSDALTYLLPTRRADAMLQERYDFLSKDKRVDFVVWRASILAKIAQAVPNNSAMVVDV